MPRVLARSLMNCLQGFLTDYFTAIPGEFGAEAPDSDAPAFLLVHGFGAFGEQWRSQLRGLAAEGHMVRPLVGYAGSCIASVFT